MYDWFFGIALLLGVALGYYLSKHENSDIAKMF